MKVFGIIPARYASSRFPGKPLVKIRDKYMIQYVYEGAMKSSSLEKLIVATDDNRIFDAVKSFGGNVMMTSVDHKSGTDRCGEIARLMIENKQADENDIVINIQGDEPFVDPQQLQLIISLFDNDKIEIGTLVRKIKTNKLLFDPNVVKVIINNEGKALYFSRQTLPYVRNADKEKWLEGADFYEHIGIYAFRLKTLLKVIELPVSKLEKNEGLEQLRWLENAFDVYVKLTEFKAVSIDTPEDLEKLNQFLD
jgi:3-deoxy-manno-octulosonate cytidylyltransferase (CMP-KDO synthetase)